MYNHAAWPELYTPHAWIPVFWSLQAFSPPAKLNSYFYMIARSISTGQKKSTSLSKAALLVAIFSIVSRLFGVLRDRLLAATFGADRMLDIYYAAFKIPDFIFNTFVLGALASALIPVYIQYREQTGKASAMALAGQVLNFLTMILTGCVVLAAFAAPWLIKLIAPGFDAQAIAQTVTLTRIMLLAVIIFGVSNVASSILQAEQRFLPFSLAPAMYNVGIITGLFVFVPGLGLIGLAWGVVLGSLLHLFVQLPAWLQTGMRWQPLFSPVHNGLRQVVALLGPRTLGLAAQQINQIITVSFISRLAAGSVAAFNLAQNLHSFPINVVGVSLAIAVFPMLSQAYSANDHTNFIEHFSKSIRQILFYAIPLAVLFLVLRAQIVRVVLGSGEFDWPATIRTAQVLGFLAMAIVSDSVLPVVARTFYALKDTATPVLAALVSIIVNFSLLLLLKNYALAGIGFAYVCASITNLVILLVMLGGRLRNLNSHYIIGGVWRMVIAALGAGVAAYGMLYLIAPWVNMTTFIGVFSQGVGAGLTGLFCYITISAALSLPEVAFARRWLRQAWQIMLSYF